MATQQQILNKYGEKWTRAIQESLKRNNRKATGKTVRSVNYKVTEDVLIVKGAKHIDNIIDGRGRSKSSSGGGWIDQLKEWAEARGIPSGAVWAIYTSINQKGWSTPPTPNLITSVITDQEINTLKRELAKNQLSLVRAEIRKSLK